MKRILIIGNGVVGKNIRKFFPEMSVKVHDPQQGIEVNPEHNKNSFDIGFVCVPTEKLENGHCDTSIVQSVIEEFRGCCKVLCIRSTVTPGFTETFKDICIFQPEYYGATQHANDNDYDFIILGGERHLVNIAAEVYKEVYTARVKIMKTDSRTAEVCKYMENSFLAMKVSFCAEFFRLSEVMKIDYDELRELFVADPRVNPSHTFIYRDHPFYNSHCLDKDIPAIIKAAEFSGFNMPLMSAVMKINEGYKNKE